MNQQTSLAAPNPQDSRYHQVLDISAGHRVMYAQDSSGVSFVHILALKRASAAVC